MTDFSQLRGGLPMDDLLIFTRTVERFDTALKTGNSPFIEDFLISGSPEATLTQSLLRELIVCEVNHCKNNDQETKIESYYERFPLHRDIVESAFDKAERDSREDKAAACKPPEGYGKWIPWETGELARIGGFGEVRISEHDRQFDRPVAIKMLLRRMLEYSFGRRMMDFEADILGTLDHPSIPPVFGRGVSKLQGRPYFAMRLVKGNTLTQALKNTDGDQIPRLVDIVRRVSEAMGYCHSQHILHRDLKPNNIMVGSFGEVQIIDWGLACYFGQANTIFPAPGEESSAAVLTDSPIVSQSTVTYTRFQKGILGTPAYMSKEQAEGKNDELTPASDVFALGAILCEVLTGCPPYEPANKDCLKFAAQADLAEAWERLENVQRSGKVDRDLVEICKQCLASEPEKRFTDCRKLAERLSQYQSEVRKRLRKREDAEVRRKAVRNWVIIASVFFSVLVGFAAFVGYVRVKQKLEFAAGSSQVNDSLSQKLTSIEHELSQLLADQRSRAGWRRLRNGLPSWDRRLDLLRASLQEAKSVTQSTNFAVHPTIHEKLSLSEGRFSELEFDRNQIWKRVDEIRRSTLVREVDLDGAALINRSDEYRKFFETWNLFDLGSGAQGEIVDAINGSRTPWLWIDVLDDYANHLEIKNVHSLRKKIREVAIAVDSDAFANQLRELDLGDFFDSKKVRKLSGEDKLRECSPELISLVSEAMRLRGSNESAINLLVDAAYHQEDNFSLWMEVATHTPNHTLRSQALAAALALEPTNFTVHAELGILRFEEAELLVNENKWNEAEKRYGLSELRLDKALTYSNGTVQTIFHHNLGVIIEKHDQLQRTRQQDLFSWLQDANRRYQFGRAKHHYLEAVRVFPDNLKSLTNLGANEESENNSVQAEAYYRKALQARSDHSTARINLGNLLIRQSKLEEAKQLFEAELDRSTKKVEALHGLAEIAAKSGNVEDAIERLERVIQACEVQEGYGKDCQYARYARQEIAKYKRAMNHR